MSSDPRRGVFVWLALGCMTFVSVALGGVACSTTNDGAGSSGGAATSSGTGASGGTSGAAASGGRGASAGETGASGGTATGSAGTTSSDVETGGNSGAGPAGGGRAGATAGRGGRGAPGGSGGTASGAAGTSGATGEAGASGAATDGVPTLFWLDVSGTVLVSPADPFKKSTLVSSAGDGPDGIAVDLDGGHVFWTNMGNTAKDDGYIRRADLDGKNVTTVVPAGGTFTPKQMKLEPIDRKLYWSDREGMRVQRADLDGANVETLYTAAEGDEARKDLSNHCVGIAVDREGGYFYWSQKGPDNGGVGSLRRAHLVLPDGENDRNRSDVEILYAGLPEPIDIDLDLEQGFIYWTDRGDDTINRGPIELPDGETAATRTDREVIVPEVKEAIGIWLDRRRGLVYYTGANGQVGRSRYDGSNAAYLMTTGGAFTGIQVVDLPTAR